MSWPAQPTADAGVLSGRRVLDVSSMIAGPYAAMLLADMGADVLKVEPLTGDPARGLGPPVVGEDSAAFHSVNRNKASLALDLTSPEGRARLADLLADADVVIHNALPAVARRLGLSGAALLDRHPGLVVVEIGGFSPEGADADRPAYDIIIAAVSGLMSVTGDPAGRPLRPGAPMIDVATGSYAALGAVSALLSKEASGKGQVVRVNMVDTAVSLQATNFAYHFATGSQPPRMGNGSYFAVSNCFQTADSWIVIAVGTDRLWHRLVDALGDDSLHDESYASNQDRLRHAAEIEASLSAVMVRRTTQEWSVSLKEHEVPHAPILEYAEVVEYLRSNHSTLWEFDRADTGRVPVIGNPLSFSAVSMGVRRPPPLLGPRTPRGDGEANS